MIELDWWESTDVIGATITATPAMHWSNRTMLDRRRTLWGGCVLKVPDAPLIYFAGDSGYAPFFSTIRERLGAPDVALLPIGAYEPRWFMQPFHMTPEEAVRAHREVGARVSIATHHSYFRLADDGFEAPARLLADARAAAGVPPDDVQDASTSATTAVARPDRPTRCSEVDADAPARRFAAALDGRALGVEQLVADRRRERPPIGRDGDPLGEDAASRRQPAGARLELLRR